MLNLSEKLKNSSRNQQTAFRNALKNRNTLEATAILKAIEPSDQAAFGKKAVSRYYSLILHADLGMLKSLVVNGYQFLNLTRKNAELKLKDGSITIDKKTGAVMPREAYEFIVFATICQKRLRIKRERIVEGFENPMLREAVLLNLIASKRQFTEALTTPLQKPKQLRRI